MRIIGALILLSLSLAASSTDNQLTREEKQAGWILLFDGHSLNGWVTSNQKVSARPIEHGSINPHNAGGYMMIHEKQWADFLLSLDFKISKGCNSGIFVRTFPLTPRPGKDVGFNGIEIAIDDTATAGFHDTGAIYDLVKPAKNAMHPADLWNHIEITCDRNIISVNLNGQAVSRIDLDEWAEANKRPDGTPHKFDIAYKDHPRKGYIGLQDHGADCWFKNIKLKPLSLSRFLKAAFLRDSGADCAIRPVDWVQYASESIIAILRIAKLFRTESQVEFPGKEIQRKLGRQTNITHAPAVE